MDFIDVMASSESVSKAGCALAGLDKNSAVVATCKGDSLRVHALSGFVHLPVKGLDMKGG